MGLVEPGGARCPEELKVACPSFYMRKTDQLLISDASNVLSVAPNHGPVIRSSRKTHSSVGR